MKIERWIATNLLVLPKSAVRRSRRAEFAGIVRAFRVAGDDELASTDAGSKGNSRVPDGQVEGRSCSGPGIEGNFACQLSARWSGNEGGE